MTPKHNRHLRWNRKCLPFGEPTGNRTQDLRIKSPVLYQLSYRLYSVLYLIQNRRFAHPSQDFLPHAIPLHGLHIQLNAQPGCIRHSDEAIDRCQRTVD